MDLMRAKKEIDKAIELKKQMIALYDNAGKDMQVLEGYHDSRIHGEVQIRIAGSNAYNDFLELAKLYEAPVSERKYDECVQLNFECDGIKIVVLVRKEQISCAYAE